jgi:Family of unknown function (DUF6174)
MRRPHWTPRAATPERRLTRNVRSAAMAAAAAVLLTGALSATAQAQAPTHPVDPHIVDGTAQQQLNAARQRWQAAHVGDYHFTVERLCFCAPASRGPATIVVRDGAPLAPPAAFADVATVPRLHAVVQKAINDQVERLDVTYDARGVPLSISIDVSSMIADEETAYRITDFTVDSPRYFAKGDIRLRLHWEGPRGNATRTLVCRDGVLRSAWPDPAVCTRVLATPALAKPITIETKDLRFTADPRLFSVGGHIEGRLVQFTWPGQGSGTKLARLREWETALGPDAIAEVRGS